MRIWLVIPAYSFISNIADYISHMQCDHLCVNPGVKLQGAVIHRGGGTDPRKGRVGSPGCRKHEIYLYHFVKKGGQFSTFKAKRGVNALPLKLKRGSMLYRFGQNLHKSLYFGQNLG